MGNSGVLDPFTKLAGDLTIWTGQHKTLALTTPQEDACAGRRHLSERIDN